MGNSRGGYRIGAGRKKGSKNKWTIAKETLSEVIDPNNPEKIIGAVHSRGHVLLTEMERIATDPTQPVAARIMAARTALPFLLARPMPDGSANSLGFDLVETLQQRRRYLCEIHASSE